MVGRVSASNSSIAIADMTSISQAACVLWSHGAPQLAGWAMGMRALHCAIVARSGLAQAADTDAVILHARADAPSGGCGLGFRLSTASPTDGDGVEKTRLRMPAAAELTNSDDYAMKVVRFALAHTDGADVDEFLSNPLALATKNHSLDSGPGVGSKLLWRTGLDSRMHARQKT